MNRFDCFFERFANFSVALALLSIGLGFTVIGVTILPVVGLIVALPVIGLSFVFFAAQRSHACQVVLNKRND